LLSSMARIRSYSAKCAALTCWARCATGRNHAPAPPCRCGCLAPCRHASRRCRQTPPAPVGQPGGLQLMAQHAFGSGRAADVAQAHEQNAHQASSKRRTRSRSSGVSTPTAGASMASST
jgi:hypothetical protein